MRLSVQFKLAFLAMGLCCLQAGAARGPAPANFDTSPPELTSYEREKLQRIAREEQDRFRKRATIPSDAIQNEADLPASAKPGGAYTRATIGLRPSAEAVARARLAISLAAAAMLTALLAFRRFAPRLTTVINTKFDPWAMSPAAARKFALQVRAEEASFAEFLVAFRTGQSAAPRPSPVTEAGPVWAAPKEVAGPDSRKESRSVNDFFTRAPERLTALQKLLEEIRWTTKPTANQRQLLEEFGRQLGVLKGQAGLSELLPAWQMVCALEGLIKQLTSKSSYVTASTLRTVGISLELLQELCAKGLPAEVASHPFIRLLAVDDDPITRHALSWSLSKALSQPDLAENGPAALDLVTRQAYDVIFLDVQMPGMDGFELCSRIHETGPNRITPVVFVTCQSDFNARAESAFCGGVDLIAKPFLTFEVTLVALTLALRRRLQAGDRIPDAAESWVAPAGPAPSVHRATRPAIPAPKLHRLEPEIASPKVLRSMPPQSPPPARPAEMVLMPAAARPSPEVEATSAREDSLTPSDQLTNELASAFFAQAPAHVKAFRNVAQLIRQTDDAAVRQEMLVDLYLFIHSLTINAGLAELRPAFQTSAALEGLLKKLVDDPENVNYLDIADRRHDSGLARRPVRGGTEPGPGLPPAHPPVGGGRRSHRLPGAWRCAANGLRQTRPGGKRRVSARPRHTAQL